MKRVLFYTQNRWAYGSIHHGLCKELYKHGIYANLLDWTQSYSLDEFRCLNKSYDIFVTNPEAVCTLHKNYQVPLNKIIAMAHGQWDMLLAKKEASFDFYPLIKEFAVVSNVLKTKAEEFKLSRIPKVVEFGIHFDMFYREPAANLHTIGYGGAKETVNFHGQEIKRGKLVEQALEGTGLKLQMHGFYNHLCMPGYYDSIDAVVMSSIEESAGLPMLEAAAAGRLCLGTPVGYFERNGPAGGGVVMPLDADHFVMKAKETLCHYRDNPVDYRRKCLEIQQYARDHYDWSKVVSQWVELFLY